MPHPLLARLLLTALAAGQGAGALVIDLRRSHATNPLWTRHARFHVVWQVLNLALLALVEIGLIWWTGQAPAHFYLAACLCATNLVSFWWALASMRLYAGALFDPNGILPWKLQLAGRSLRLDMNTVAVTFASVLLLISIAIYR